MATGRLKPEDEYRIDANYGLIRKNLIVDDGSFLPAAIERSLLDVNDRGKIDNTHGQYDKAVKFLTIMKGRGPSAYEKFLYCLEEGGYTDIITKLDETVVDADRANPWRWFDESVDDRIKQHVIVDADASRIARCLGGGWEQFFLEFGLRPNEIRMEKRKYFDDETLCVCHLIIRWKQKQTSPPTVGRFIGKLKDQERERDLSVDIDRLRNTVMSITI